LFFVERNSTFGRLISASPRGGSRKSAEERRKKAANNEGSQARVKYNRQWQDLQWTHNSFFSQEYKHRVASPKWLFIHKLISPMLGAIRFSSLRAIISFESKKKTLREEEME
jgi:hypothetical protein